MIARLVEARHAGAHRVWLRFNDGVEGEIDLQDELWGEVFEPLRDVAEFGKLTADKELHTLVWPNGADFSPEWLYRRVAAAKGAEQRIVARTGDICPESGIWKALDDPGQSVAIVIGSRMPPLRGRKVDWVYARAA